MTTQTNQDNTLTLRDQFAMAALTGLLAWSYDGYYQPDDSCAASNAYAYADAMMEERKRAAGSGD